MRLVRIQRPEPIRGRRLRQDTSPSSWETRVRIPSAAPICARSKTGQCAGLRIRAVEVRVLPCAPIHQGVGEPGRPCLPWKQETGGSNPPTLTNLMSKVALNRILQVFVLMHDLIRKVCNFSGSCISSVGRAPLSESGCPRFKSATGCQSTRCPSGQGALCKSADAGSIPALVSRLQWLERKGTDLLNRQMLVRIQPGAPRVQCFHGRVAQRMSADFLHRRMHVRIRVAVSNQES